MGHLLSLVCDLVFVELIGGLVRWLATLVVMLVRRCDWRTASATVDEWEERANRPGDPRRGAVTWTVIGGVLILTTAVLVLLAMAPSGPEGD